MYQTTKRAYFIVYDENGEELASWSECLLESSMPPVPSIGDRFTYRAELKEERALQDGDTIKRIDGEVVDVRHRYDFTQTERPPRRCYEWSVIIQINQLTTDMETYDEG